MPNKFVPPQTDSITRTAATPLNGEVLYDIDEKKLYHGDGTTVGGVALGSLTNSTPATASSTGVAGTVLYDSGYIYVCVSANVWKRAELLTW